MIERFAFLAKWYKEQKTSWFGGGCGVVQTPKEGVEKVFGCVFRVDPAKEL